MQEEAKNQQEAGWVFKAGGDSSVSGDSTAKQPTTDGSPAETGVSWTASEYVSHPKNISWFAMLAAASVILAVVVYLITHDIVSTVVIVVLGIIVGVFAARQPRVLEYSLDRRGVHLGLRFYPYEYFKSFSIVSEDAFNYITLLPLKRFMPPLAVHFAPDDEDKIINTLADYLPFEEHKRDLIDSFSRRMKF